MPEEAHGISGKALWELLKPSSSLPCLQERRFNKPYFLNNLKSHRALKNSGAAQFKLHRTWVDA
jgi:hypothetical protein